MISFHNINSIAKYERTTLLRSWFFRIFGILSLIVLFFMNFGMISEGGQAVWVYRAIPSTIPYFNLLILNVAQAIIAVFLASDFLKRDKKLDTTEVIYMRSMTNGEYVIGKTWGNLQVFLVLNIIVLFMALIFNMLATATYVNWGSYLIYILLISIPTLVFIMGLSFLLMSIIRNQAVTFILILGYIGITLFLLKAKYYYLFDYMAFNIPMLQSDVVGFGNMLAILIHRGLYFSLGAGFIFLTIFLLKRLPQSETTTYISVVLSVLLIGSGLTLGFIHINRFKSTEKIRSESIDLNSMYAGRSFADVTQHALSLTHQGETFSVESGLALVNNNSRPVDTLIFTLNPGLEVTKVVIEGKETDFKRDKHLLFINPSGVLAPQDSMKLNISYSGKINEAFCYLDIDPETYTSVKKVENTLNIDKRFSFSTPDYLLLTPEAGWYPRPGVTYNPGSIGWIRNYFTDFKLEVKTDTSLQAVSQGAISEVNPGHFRFENEQPLSQISLAIGKYRLKTIEADGVQFGIWYIDGHDFFSNSLPAIKDTIPQIINDRFKDFQRLYSLRYSFKRLSIVEVPAQFASFERKLISNQENMQPEQIFIPEKGFQMGDVDFRRRIKREEQWRKRSGETLTPQEYQVSVFNNFIGNFNSEQGRMDFFRGGPGMGVPNAQASAEKSNPYFIFPLLYGFQNSIRSDRWPITNRIFEAYLKSMNTDMRSAFMRNISGTNEDEMATIALQDSTFEEILADPMQKRIVDNVIKLKGDVLFSMIQLKAGDVGFENFIRGILNDNKFKTISFSEFDKMVEGRFGISLTPFMENWFKEKSLPGYLFSPVKAVKVTSDEQIKTMVTMKVTNFANTDGVIKLIFRLGGFGGGPGRGGSRMGRPMGGGFGPNPNDMVTKLVQLGPNQTKDLSYLLMTEPRMVTINTLTSRNIPQMLMVGFPAIEEDTKAKPFEGEVISESAVSMTLPNETILDNEDSGFTVTTRANTSLLRKWIKNESVSTQKYSGYNPWRPPVTWTATTNTDLFGQYVRSGYYIKSGDGSQKATWNIPVKEPAYYELYYYVYKPRSFRHDEAPQKGEYHFIIHHDDGEEEQTLDIGGASQGWNMIGSYYFSPDSVKIELTDKSEMPTVFADAVKIVKL